jgi:hypothetical protein
MPETPVRKSQKEIDDGIRERAENSKKDPR